MSFIYSYSHFQYLLCNQPVLFAQLENVNELWNNNHTVHVNERNQNKNKTKSSYIQIDHGFYCLIQPRKKCNCIIQGWLLRLTSESKGRFLVNNICLFMAQIQFSLIKKIKIGRSEHLLIPHSPTSNNILPPPSPRPPTPLKLDVICVSPLNSRRLWIHE